jgi:hypothetical protein
MFCALNNLGRTRSACLDSRGFVGLNVFAHLMSFESTDDAFKSAHYK